MENFWDFSVWGGVNICAVLLISPLTGNLLKRKIAFLRNSLVPTSVLGGVLLLIVSAIYRAITGNVMFNTSFFGGKGMSTLEVLTYHALALGFIATALKTSDKKLTKQRNIEIFNKRCNCLWRHLILLQHLALIINIYICISIIFMICGS